MEGRTDDNPDRQRWRRIEDLYTAAAEMPVEERAAYLDGECGADATLRREVESLLRADGHAAQGFLSPEQLGQHIEDLAASARPLVGRTLGRYEVVKRIGAGAMGEVYLARDRELGRKAALKILLPAQPAGGDASWRFVQEAKAASALNHPNILTVYEIGEPEGTKFIATEYVDGETVRSRITKGAMSLAEVLAIGIQCASALEAAHQAGIIHRDIKPENIMVRPDGLVKVLDFGLARATEAYEGSVHVHTAEGAILGTPRYMSPEQAAGRRLDARTDVFSLASVLFELLTGEPCFAGDSVGAVFGSLLGSGNRVLPPVFQSFPAVVGETILKGLEKNPDHRFATMRDFREGLLRAQRSLVVGERAHAVAAQRPSRVWVGAAVVLAVTVAVVMVWRGRPAREALTGSPQVLLPTPFTSEAGYEYEPRLSPDARWVAYTRESRERRPEVVVQEIGSASPPRVVAQGAFSAAWTPSGDAIAVLEDQASPATLRRGVMLAKLSDGSMRKIAEIDTPNAFQGWLPGPYIDFSPDGRYLLASDGWNAAAARCSLVLISLQNGDKTQLTAADPGTHGDFAPRFAPDGRRIVFTRVPRFAASTLHVLELAEGGARNSAANSPPLRIETTDLWNAFPAWTSDSRHIVYAGGGLRAARLKMVSIPGRGSTKAGKEIDLPIQETAVTTLDLRPVAAADGGRTGVHRLIYTHFPRNDDILRVPLTKGDAEANGQAAEPLINSSLVDEEPVYSPDGSQVAFLSDRTGALQLWVAKADGTSPRQVTHAPSADFHHPAWSPDGKRLAVQTVLPKEAGIFEVTVADGSLKHLVAGQAHAPAYSPDGRWLYFGSRRSGSSRLWRIPAGGGNPEMVPDLEGDALVFTPDGRSIVYANGLKVYQRRASGGPSTLLFPVVYSHQSFTATNAAVYGVVRQMDGRWVLMAHRQDGTQKVATYPREVANGISVSPDGRNALLTQREHLTLDLMLVDGVDLSRYYDSSR